MVEPQTFADRLHALCQDEMVRIGTCPDAAAAMTTEIAAALTDAIALLTRGQVAPARKLVADVVAYIPKAVWTKAEAVREELEDQRHAAGGARG